MDLFLTTSNEAACFTSVVKKKCTIMAKVPGTSREVSELMKVQQAVCRDVDALGAVFGNEQVTQIILRRFAPYTKIPNSKILVMAQQFYQQTNQMWCMVHLSALINANQGAALAGMNRRLKALENKAIRM